MNRKISILILCLSTPVWSQSTGTSLSTSTHSLENNWLGKLKDRLGVNYMSFFDGPGLFTDQQSITPNALGNPSDDGLVLMNNLSLKYQLRKDLSLDFQIRFHYVMTNGNEVEDFGPFRWQSPRLGISTTFFKTENAKLTGAFNSDLPYYFPEPVGGGYIAEKRTTILTPGLFAKYAYTPTTSRWSLFSLVQPRFYIYENRNVAEDQLSRSGYSPRLKNEFTMSLSPSVNYAFTDKFGTRLGTEFIYKKLVVSSWNPTNSSSRSADPDSKAWRLQPMPLQLGFTYTFSPILEVSTYVQGFPVASQRLDKKGNTTNFENTISAGAWISGTLF